MSALLDLVAARAARPVGDADLDLPLGSAGLGLDSVAVAELLLDVEQRFGVTVTDLLSSDTLTMRRLMARVEP
ncbi:MAG TPA: acyl carrier protein [Thermoanaerobaculia bacterium]